MSGGGDGGVGAGHPDGGHGARGEQFQSSGAVQEEGGACFGHRGGVWLVEASELFWVFLVGVGNAGRAGECGVFGGVCDRAVEVL